MLRHTIYRRFHTSTKNNTKHNLKRYIRRPDSTRQRNHKTQNKPRKQRKQIFFFLKIDNVIYAPDCPIRLISPQQLHRQSKAKGHENSCFTTEETTATLFHVGDAFTCAYHPKTKMPTLCCVTDKSDKRTYTTSSTNLAQQPSYKGRKQVIVNKTNNTTAPTAYITNLKTTQQELLRLHETYTHADMRGLFKNGLEKGKSDDLH
jgi:hypothetical protein